MGCRNWGEIAPDWGLEGVQGKLWGTVAYLRSVPWLHGLCGRFLVSWTWLNSVCVPPGKRTGLCVALKEGLAEGEGAWLQGPEGRGGPSPPACCFWGVSARLTSLEGAGSSTLARTQRGSSKRVWMEICWVDPRLVGGRVRGSGDLLACPRRRLLAGLV